MGQYLADKLSRPVGLGMVEKLIRLARFHQQTLDHEYNAMRNLAGKTHFVGYHAHGDSLFGQLHHHIEHFPDHLRIQAIKNAGDTT